MKPIKTQANCFASLRFARNDIFMNFCTDLLIGLSEDSNDRVVWQVAQTNGMPLLTANRNAKGEDSLEQVILNPGYPSSL